MKSENKSAEKEGLLIRREILFSIETISRHKLEARPKRNINLNEY